MREYQQKKNLERRFTKPKKRYKRISPSTWQKFRKNKNYNKILAALAAQPVQYKWWFQYVKRRLLLKVITLHNRFGDKIPDEEIENDSFNYVTLPDKAVYNNESGVEGGSLFFSLQSIKIRFP